jgi:hypothetical protein
MEDFLLLGPGRELAGVDEYTQGEALAGWDDLAHRESAQASYTGCGPARHRDSAPGERSVPVEDGVPAMQAGAVLVMLCSGPQMIQVVGGVLRGP